MRLFTPQDNLNSDIQFGTELLPFPRSNDCTFQWKWGLPYVKYGCGYYDVSQEFQNPGLYGWDDWIQTTSAAARNLPNETTKAFKWVALSVPISMGTAAAGFAYGIKQKSFGKAMFYGSAAGLIPITLAWINLIRTN